jgi:hypothetical protein
LSNAIRQEIRFIDAPYGGEPNEVTLVTTTDYDNLSRPYRVTVPASGGATAVTTTGQKRCQGASAKAGER